MISYVESRECIFSSIASSNFNPSVAFKQESCSVFIAYEGFNNHIS